MRARFLTVVLLIGTLTSVTSAAGRSDVADAAQKHDLAAVLRLITAKADVNAPQIDGATAIVYPQE